MEDEFTHAYKAFYAYPFDPDLSFALYQGMRDGVVEPKYVMQAIAPCIAAWTHVLAVGRETDHLDDLIQENLINISAALREGCCRATNAFQFRGYILQTTRYCVLHYFENLPPHEIEGFLAREHPHGYVPTHALKEMQMQYEAMNEQLEDEVLHRVRFPQYLDFCRHLIRAILRGSVNVLPLVRAYGVPKDEVPFLWDYMTLLVRLVRGELLRGD